MHTSTRGNLGTQVPIAPFPRTGGWTREWVTGYVNCDLSLKGNDIHPQQK